MRRLCRVDWIDWVFIQWLGLGRNGGQTHTEYNFFFWEESEKRLWAQEIECVNCAVRAPGWVSLRIGVICLVCMCAVGLLTLFISRSYSMKKKKINKTIQQKQHGKCARASYKNRHLVTKSYTYRKCHRKFTISNTMHIL